MSVPPNTQNNKKLLAAKLKIFKERYRSGIKLINTILRYYSMVLAIRVDFGYEVKYRDNLTIDDVLKDIEKLQNNKYHNSIFQSYIASILKIEQGKEKNNYHIHGLLFLDGHKIREFRRSIIKHKPKLGRPKTQELCLPVPDWGDIRLWRYVTNITY